LASKWTSFGWEVVEVDGHDLSALQQVLAPRRPADGKPLMVIAHTVKGKGISFMENTPIWHFRMPGDQELEIVKEELGFDPDEWEALKGGRP